MKPLVVVPVFMHKEQHKELLVKCLESLRNKEKTNTDIDIMIVDDCSPIADKDKFLDEIKDLFNVDVRKKDSNTGYSKTVNIGLIEAHEQRRVCVLCNMDMEFGLEPEWLNIAIEDEGDLVGARLLYPNGLVQHGGVYHSCLHRYWDHLYRFAPANLLEANVRAERPVTGALHVIKPQVMDAIGYYDENFSMAYEDVDVCLRAMLPPEHGGAGLKVVYNPKVVAIHHESVIRGGNEKCQRWHDEGFQYLNQKHAFAPLERFMPGIDRRRDEDRDNNPHPTLYQLATQQAERAQAAANTTS